MITDRVTVARINTLVMEFNSSSMRPILLLGWLLFMAALHSCPV